MALIDRLTNGDSPDYITLDMIKSWVRIEHTLDDDLLFNLRLVAVNEATNFTQNDFTHIDDGGNTVDDPIPFNVVLSCLMMIGYFYENRGESQTSLPHNCIRLLVPYKKLVGL
jgi:Phage gp6-like head-tail connector protein